MLKHLINERSKPIHCVFTIKVGQILHFIQKNVLFEASNYKYDVSNSERQRAQQLVYREFAKLHALYAKNVLTCQHALPAYVVTCLACLRAQVPTCLACSRANVPCVLTYSRFLFYSLFKVDITNAMVILLIYNILIQVD